MIYCRLILLFLLFSFCLGCSQRINANVSAMAEQGYSTKGQSVSIGPLPTSEKVLSLDENLHHELTNNLSMLGYIINHTPSKTNAPQVHVRYYWQSFGPYITYTENPLWDFSPYRTGPWRKPKVTKETHFLRTLIIEAWANNLDSGEEFNQDGLAPFLQNQLNYKDAISYLPKFPARLLWRVEAKSLGSLQTAEKILAELFSAAMPWMARNVDARVMVQDGENVNLPQDDINPIIYP